MRTPARNQVSLIILAGGQGRRLMGKDKARLRWHQHTLLDQLVRQFEDHFREVVVVRARSRGTLFRRPKVVWAHDQQAYQGPVSGLVAGLQRATAPWCLCLPVDCVAPPSDLLRRLSRSGGSYASFEGQDYYLHSLMPRRSRHCLRDFQQQGGRAMKNACQVLGLRSQPCDNAPPSIWSLNTPAELRHARWRRLIK